MLPVRRAITALAVFLLPFGAVQVGAARHLADQPPKIMLASFHPAAPPVYVLPEIITPVDHPADVAARDARFAAESDLMAQWAVDGERARVEAEAAEAARQEAEALELARRATSAVAARANTQAPSASAAGGSQPGGVWGCIRAHESGGTTDTNGNYSDPNGGAYQFEDGTWQSLGYSGSAQDYPPSVQDEAAQRLQAAEGWGPWPNTSRICGAA